MDSILFMCDAICIINIYLTVTYVMFNANCLYHFELDWNFVSGTNTRERPSLPS